MTDDQLRRRRVASQLEFLAMIGRGSDGARTLEAPGLRGSVCPSRPDRSVLNAVVYEDPDVLVDAIDDLARAYAGAGIEAWTVWVPEGDRAVAEALAAAGHELDGVPHEMACELADLDLEPRREIELDEDPAWLNVAEVNEAAYGHSAGGAYFGPTLLGMAGRPYLARLDGRPASCLAIFDVDDDAYVGLVATRPEAQRRGLAGELLRRALADARERGMATSSLEATASGAPVYASVGFRDLGVVQMWERRARAPG